MSWEIMGNKCGAYIVKTLLYVPNRHASSNRHEEEKNTHDISL